jgi:GNAT superfamily N-acetyltransferase
VSKSAELPKFFFEPLGEQHDRAAFSCGNESLDKYFKGDPIRQDMSRRLAAAFVVTSDGSTVAGFYTLSSLSITSSDLPEKLAKKLPSRLPIPTTLIGRMGVHVDLQGKGIGTDLLMDALHQAFQASKTVASWAVVVDAKEGARDFYLKHGFIPMPSSPNRMFIPMKTIEQIFSGRK